MTKESVFTNITDVETIPEKDLPLLVLSADAKSFISWAIRRRTNAFYNHLMWMIRPGFFATQDWWYRESPIKKYEGTQLKFWHNPNWEPRHKALIVYKIREELKKPAWQTRYDLLAIIGQLLGVAHIQTPWTNICSDWAQLLKIADSECNLDCPDPGDVDTWLKTKKQYVCYSRYIPS